MLIGLTGYKQVGKDTTAAYLIQEYNFEKLAFADTLKSAVANLFDIDKMCVEGMKSDGEIPLAEVILQYKDSQWSWTWREFLQRFGTEMGRNTFGQDFWIDLWEQKFHFCESENVVATDVRFENEATRIHYFGGYVVEIHRPGYEPDGHASEAGLPEESIDAWIDNTGTIDDLYDDIDGLVEDIENGQINRLGLSSGD